MISRPALYLFCVQFGAGLVGLASFPALVFWAFVK